MSRRHRHGPSPLENYTRGVILCPGCSSFMALADYPPLEEAECPRCGKLSFVPKRVAKFWLFRHLGGGGMGRVYQAYHEDFPDKPIAVKILPPEMRDSGKAIHHLEREARTMEALREHPCIANSLGSGVEDGEHYVAMEFVEGERMDEKVDRLEGLPEGELLLIALRLLAADAHIYSRGFLYRDLKPQNVILTEERGAFLYDFGICVAIEEAMDDSAELIAGTPMYFPPERLTGEGEKVSSEIYSLGMVMYNGLTGRTFFTNREIEAMAAKEVLPAMLINRNKMEGISQDIVQVLQRMIQRNPRKRYQRFVELERDLMRLLWVRAKRDRNGQSMLHLG